MDMDDSFVQPTQHRPVAPVAQATASRSSTCHRLPARRRRRRGPWTRSRPPWARRAGTGASSWRWATACPRRRWRGRWRPGARSSRCRRGARRPCGARSRRRSGTTTRSTPRTSGTGRRCSTSSRASCCPRRRGRHKDSGALSILHRDDAVGGLDVRRRSDGEWVRVEPVPGSLVVNVGDIIQVWSNDRYESAEHRASVNSEKERFSIPYFFNPAMGTLVEPLEEMVSEEDPARYVAYSWGEFFCTRRRSNFRKMDADNTQIAHLRKEYKDRADSKSAMPAFRLNESDIAV